MSQLSLSDSFKYPPMLLVYAIINMFNLTVWGSTLNVYRCQILKTKIDLCTVRVKQTANNSNVTHHVSLAWYVIYKQIKADNSDVTCYVDVTGVS